MDGALGVAPSHEGEGRGSHRRTTVGFRLVVGLFCRNAEEARAVTRGSPGRPAECRAQGRRAAGKSRERAGRACMVEAETSSKRRPCLLQTRCPCISGLLTSQQALATCTPAWPMWIEITSRLRGSKGAGRSRGAAVGGGTMSLANDPQNGAPLCLRGSPPCKRAGAPHMVRN